MAGKKPVSKSATKAKKPAAKPAAASLPPPGRGAGRRRLACPGKAARRQEQRREAVAPKAVPAARLRPRSLSRRRAARGARPPKARSAAAAPAAPIARALRKSPPVDMPVYDAATPRTCTACWRVRATSRRTSPSAASGT